MECAHGVWFDEDFDVLDYMALDGEKEVLTVLDHLLLEFKAVVAHPETTEHITCNFQTENIDQWFKLLDHPKNLGEAEHCRQTFKGIRMV